MHSTAWESLGIWSKRSLYYITSKKTNYFTFEKLNGHISIDEFSYYNSKYKPSPVNEQKFTSNDNSLKQHSKLKLLDEYEIEHIVYFLLLMLK